VLEPAQRAAAVVQTDAMRESGPGERIDLLYVVQELDQLVGPGANPLGRVSLLDGVEIVPPTIPLLRSTA
jgi:hypothetical protein